MSSKQDDDEYKKALDQIYQIQAGTDNTYQTYGITPPFTIPPGTNITGTISGGVSGGITSPGKFTPPCAMVTDMPYFVLWYDTLSRIYVGTWCADDEAAIAEAQALQNDKTKHCGQVLIMERGQQWLRTWERR